MDGIFNMTPNTTKKNPAKIKIQDQKIQPNKTGFFVFI